MRLSFLFFCFILSCAPLKEPGGFKDHQFSITQTSQPDPVKTPPAGENQEKDKKEEEEDKEEDEDKEEEETARGEEFDGSETEEVGQAPLTRGL